MSLTESQIAELKQVNSEYLKTPVGRQDLITAINLMREWNNTKADVQVGTSGVKLNQFSKRMRSRITKVPIIPIGLNNHCYTNAELFTKCGYTRCLGFNITACPCGKKISLELHGLNEKDGVLYDFTKDFNKETEKYFLKVNTKLPPHIIRDYFTPNKEGFFDMNKGCRCNIEWTTNIRAETDEDKLEKIINQLEAEHTRFLRV